MIEEVRVTTVEEAVEALRAGGARSTGQRRTILEALLASDDHHLTAEGVCDLVRERDPSIHRSSIYRTLELLVATGIVTEVQPGQRPAVYHLPAPTHTHLVCDECGSVTEASPEVLETAAARLRAEHGFALGLDGLVLRGRCASCA